MSLVVCRVAENTIQLQSDTRGWNSIASLKEDLFEGYLKIVIIDSNLCIAWAGDVATAKKGLAAISDIENDNRDINKLCQTLSAYSGRDDNCVDFIVAHYDKNAILHVLRIRNAKIIPVTELTWIGNSDAAGQFLDLWSNESSDISDPDTLQILFPSLFEKCMESSSIDTVGDFRIGVGARDKGFHYLAYMQSKYPEQFVTSKEATLYLGDTPAGGYSISCLSWQTELLQGCALYFMPAKFGIFLDPREPFEMSAIMRVEIDEFIELAQNKYGTTLEGLVPNTQGESVKIGSKVQKGSIQAQFSSTEPATFKLYKFGKEPDEAK